MTLEQLKEILRAAAEITKQSEFYVIGSAAILNLFDDPQEPFLARSNEADLIALSGDTGIADRISTAIGELSPFHEMHDVYADGVTFRTPTFAPEGWCERAIVVHYDDIDITARFMEVHDLVLSKIGAGRQKDMEFCEALRGTGYVDAHVLHDRLAAIRCSDAERRQIGLRVGRIFQPGLRGSPQ